MKSSNFILSKILVLLLAVTFSDCTPIVNDTELIPSQEIKIYEDLETRIVNLLRKDNSIFTERINTWFDSIGQVPKFNIFQCIEHEKFDTIKNIVLNKKSEKILYAISDYIPEDIIDKNYPEYLKHTQLITKKEIQDVILDSQYSLMRFRFAFKFAKNLNKSDKKKDYVIQQTKLNKDLFSIVQHESYGYHKFGSIGTVLQGKRTEKEIDDAVVTIVGNTYTMNLHTTISFIIYELNL